MDEVAAVKRHPARTREPGYEVDEDAARRGFYVINDNGDLAFLDAGAVIKRGWRVALPPDFPSFDGKIYAAWPDDEGKG